jgi:hypothetical protein
MDVYRPLRVALFSYELLRLLLLAFSFTFFSSLQAVLKGGAFPYLVYMSSNALFPLISFFLLLRPREFRNYLPLYMAGKTIAVILFYTWAVFSLSLKTGFLELKFLEPGPSGRESVFEGLILLGAAFIISLVDALSVLGAWMLNRKLSQAAEADGGKRCE